MDNSDHAPHYWSEEFSSATRPPIPRWNDPFPPFPSSSTSSLNATTATPCNLIQGSVRARGPASGLSCASVARPEWWGQKDIIITDRANVPWSGNVGSSKRSMCYFIQGIIVLSRDGPLYRLLTNLFPLGDRYTLLSSFGGFWIGGRKSHYDFIITQQVSFIYADAKS